MCMQQEMEPRTKKISAWEYATYKKTHHFKEICKERWKNKQAKKKNHKPLKNPPHQTGNFQLGYAIRNTK